MQTTSLWQRFSSHIILLGLSGLFLIGVGALGAADADESETALEEAAVAEAPAASAESAAADQVGDTAAPAVSSDPIGTPVPTVDLTRVPVLSDYSLAPELDPHTFVGERPEHNFTTYVVERGDAPASIAERFGITTETILGGNPRLSNEASQLQTGVELIILPVDGVLHTVSRGETLESVSLQYGIPAEDIIAYTDNKLEFPYRLFPDTQLVIPGALPAQEFVWNPPSLASVAGSPEALDLNVFVSGTGFHSWPVSARRLTQSYWVGHQAIDIGVEEGTAVYASDTGTVTYAAWSVYCYGNLVVINHGSTGHETFYAHLSSIGVTPGQVVDKGQYLGASGNTGCSSGPHLHYEIRLWQNRDNPLFYLP